MGGSPRFLLAAALIASASLLFPSAHAQKTREPLAEGEVMGLLRGGVAPQRVGKLALESGIGFEINRAVERDLRAAGADDQLLQTLRELAPGRGRAKPKNETPRTGALATTGILLVTVDAACKLSVDGEDSGEVAAGASKRVTLPFGEHLVRAVSNEEPMAAVEWTGKVERSEQSLVQLKLVDKVANIKHARKMAAAQAAQMERAKPFSDILGKWKSAPDTAHWEGGCSLTYEFTSEFRPENVHDDRIDEERIYFGRVSPDTTECRANGRNIVGEFKSRVVWSRDRQNGGYVTTHTQDGREIRTFTRFTSPTTFERFATVDGRPQMRAVSPGRLSRPDIYYFRKVSP